MKEFCWGPEEPSESDKVILTRFGINIEGLHLLDNNYYIPEPDPRTSNVRYGYYYDNGSVNVLFYGDIQFATKWNNQSFVIDQAAVERARTADPQTFTFEPFYRLTKEHPNYGITFRVSLKGESLVLETVHTLRLPENETLWTGPGDAQGLPDDIRRLLPSFLQNIRTIRDDRPAVLELLKQIYDDCVGDEEFFRHCACMPHENAPPRCCGCFDPHDAGLWAVFSHFHSLSEMIQYLEEFEISECPDIHIRTKYDPMTAGTSVIYPSRLFAENLTRKRKLFANRSAVVAGHRGKRFADTRAVLSGKRVPFANTLCAMGFHKFVTRHSSICQNPKHYTEQETREFQPLLLSGNS